MRFAGRVAIVTGGGAGIGRATCLAFAREGAAVAVVDLKAADAVAGKIEAAGGRATSYGADVSRSADVEAMVDDVVRRFGSVDILVNNAGIGRPGRIEEVTEEEWDRTLAVDLKAHFLACRAVVPHMRHRGRGHIVNVASIAGRHVSLANSIPYTSAKAGVIGFTRHLAQEVGPDGIRVNAVAPGPVKTELFYSAVTRGSEREAQFQARIPLRYVSEAEEQAAVILFLASDAASFVHGAIVDVNGGLL
jgi:NAD(P)-dependent dehydrogenase (short-subunit alcohol dehydrogenase family)